MAGSISSKSALAFMAGYGIKSFLIAQSLNQIEKAYGANNSILDNCHVRVSFATNDERTAKRVSDALGTATEMRAMKNYAGHRLNPWLGHLMVSRQETARPLLTPGEVMQLPPTDEIVMVAGTPPIRAKKARYFEDHAVYRAGPAAARSGEVRPVVTDRRMVGAGAADAGHGAARRNRAGAKGTPPTAACAANPSFPTMSPSPRRRPTRGRRKSLPLYSTTSRTMPPVRPAFCASRCVASPARPRSTRTMAWSL